MAERYPSATFRADDSPWPGLTAELRAFGEKLQHAQRLRDATALDRALRLAYARLAATGRADDAIAWLRGPSLESDIAQLRDRHVAVLESVRDAARHVADALRGDAPKIALRLPRRDGPGEVEVEITAEPGGGAGLRLRDATGAALPVSAVSWRLLLERAGEPAASLPADQQRRLREGQSVWLALCGDTAAVIDYLDPPAVAFFREHLEELIERARGYQQRPDVSALSVLAALNASLSAGDASGVRDALAAFQAAGYGEQTLDGDGQFLVMQAQSWLSRADARERLRRTLAERLGSEVAIEIAGDGAIELGFAVERLASGGDGWTSDGSKLAFTGQQVALPEAARRGLRVATHLERALQIALHARVRFPAAAGCVRLYVIEVGGVSAALAVLADGAAAAAILPAAQAGNAGELRRALQAPLREAAAKPAFVIHPDAAYDVELAIDAARHRPLVELRVDRTPLARATLAAASEDNGAALVALEPLCVERLRVRALLDE